MFCSLVLKYTIYYAGFIVIASSVLENVTLMHVYIFAQHWVTYLADNSESAEHFYMLTVLTAMSKDAATKATVSVRIAGDKGASAKHALCDQNVKLFQRGAEDWFILAEDKSLGRLNDLTVWVDYSNTSPSW